MLNTLAIDISYAKSGFNIRTTILKMPNECLVNTPESVPKGFPIIHKRPWMGDVSGPTEMYELCIQNDHTHSQSTAFSESVADYSQVFPTLFASGASALRLAKWGHFNDTPSSCMKCR
jgi:hypothetical protein